MEVVRRNRKLVRASAKNVNITNKSNLITSLTFEVFGRVQGVHFRRYMKFHTIKLSVRGYVSHAPSGSVVGEIQGSEESINLMKTWLSEIGSPASRIDEAVFMNKQLLDKYSYDDFSVS